MAVAEQSGDSELLRSILGGSDQVVTRRVGPGLLLPLVLSTISSEWGRPLEELGDVERYYSIGKFQRKGGKSEDVEEDCYVLTKPDEDS